MKWREKARIQRWIARLPHPARQRAYYRMQRRFGGLRYLDPSSRLAAAAKQWDALVKLGDDPTSRVFFEVGTGRAPIVPMAYWLMGADRTVTVDLNRYLRHELVLEAAEKIVDPTLDLESIFGAKLHIDRLNHLKSLIDSTKATSAHVLDLCQIDYRAPSDATHTQLPDTSIDYHTSFTVLEHIAPDVVHAILVEARRLLRPNGRLVHHIDYSDHFSHGDPTISAIHFLQFNEKEWQRLAGNPFMYMNRMRHDDFVELFRTSGWATDSVQTSEDPRSRQEVLQSSAHLQPRFRDKPVDILATTGATFVLSDGSVT